MDPQGDILALVFTLAFRANFSLTFPRKDCNGKKKDRCAVFGCNNDRLFPEKYTLKFSRALILSECSLGIPECSLNLIIQYGGRIGKKVYCGMHFGSSPLPIS